MIGLENKIYNISHEWSPGGVAADRVFYTRNPPQPGQVKYRPTTEGYLLLKRQIIQTFPIKM